MFAGSLLNRFPFLFPLSRFHPSTLTYHLVYVCTDTRDARLVSVFVLLGTEMIYLFCCADKLISIALVGRSDKMYWLLVES